MSTGTHTKKPIPTQPTHNRSNESKPEKRPQLPSQKGTPKSCGYDK